MRLYSESEIGAILKRTAELSKDVDSQNADGLSLEELKQLASEAGLNPELVVRAATEFSLGTSFVEKPDIFGGPLSHSSEIELAVEIDQDTWESMLPVIRVARAHARNSLRRTGARPGRSPYLGTFCTYVFLSLAIWRDEHEETSRSKN